MLDLIAARVVGARRHVAAHWIENRVQDRIQYRILAQFTLFEHMLQTPAATSSRPRCSSQSTAAASYGHTANTKNIPARRAKSAKRRRHLVGSSRPRRAAGPARGMQVILAPVMAPARDIIATCAVAVINPKFHLQQNAFSGPLVGYRYVVIP